MSFSLYSAVATFGCSFMTLGMRALEVLPEVAVEIVVIYVVCGICIREGVVMMLILAILLLLVKRSAYISRKRSCLYMPPA